MCLLLPICIPFAWFKNLVPYLDQIITVVLSLIMIPTPIRTVITGIRDLMLIPPEEETIEDIKSTVEPIIGIYGHKNLYYDIVRTGRKLWISVYITFDKDIVSCLSSSSCKMNVFLLLQKNILTFTLNYFPISNLPVLRRI